MVFFVCGWGFNQFGQATGIATTNAPYSTEGLVMVDGRPLSNVVAIAANKGYSLALKKDGTVIEWGEKHRSVMDRAAGLSNVIGIAAGESFSMAIIGNPSKKQEKIPRDAE